MKFLKSLREPRYPVNTPAVLRTFRAKHDVYAVTILDVSKSTMNVRSPQRFVDGTRVSVSARNTEVFGKVKSAYEIEPSSYQIEIKIREFALL